MTNAVTIQQSNSFNLFESENLNKLVQASSMLAKSGVVPDSLKGKPDSVFAILCMGAELGLAPMQSLNTIHVIQGRPTQSAQLIMGRVLQRFPSAYIKFELDEVNFSVKCYAARPGKDKEESYCATWDMKKAKMMGLTGKDNYIKQPLNMLKWRACVEALRVEFADVIMGLYATEEFQDFEGKELVNISNLNEDGIDPRTEIQKEVGNPHYLVGYGKFRGVELCNTDPEELADYEETLTERSKKGPLKTWESEVATSIRLYLRALDGKVAEVIDDIVPVEKSEIEILIEKITKNASILCANKNQEEKATWITEELGVQKFVDLKKASAEYLQKINTELEVQVKLSYTLQKNESKITTEDIPFN